MAVRARQLLPKLAFARCILAAGIAVVAAPAIAKDEAVTIYRCTAADGSLALRDSPCLSGERQQVLTMERPQDPPAQPEPEPAAELATAPAPAPAPPEVRVVVVERPPTVYECVTPDGEHYTSNSPAGNPRWAPLWTLGFPTRYVPTYPGYPGPGDQHDTRGNSDNDYLHNDLVFDAIGRPTPEPSSDRPGVPQLPPGGVVRLPPGTWIRDRCRPLSQAEVCVRLHDRYWQLRDDYFNAMQNERRRIDAEQQALNAHLAAEC